LLAAHPELPRYPQPDGRVKLAAGWLIERAGWKGRDLGPVGMYEKQALVLVNRGGATGADVLALMRTVQRDVYAKFGVELAPEPVFLENDRAPRPAGIEHGGRNGNAPRSEDQ
jgi:UDP-N-acetylmuramate dehydrogenase